MAQPKSDKDGEAYQVVWLILSAVKNLQVGKNKLAAFLKGSKSKLVATINDKQIYGGLMWHDIPTIHGFIDQLENMGMIRIRAVEGWPHDYPVLELTDAGKLVLEEKKQVLLQIIKEAKLIIIGASEKKTCELVRQGKAATEIARERNLAESTIYSHFFRLIIKDHIASSDVVSAETIKKVSEAANKLSEEATVKKIKEILPDISYEEIRCVLAGIKQGAKDEK